MLFTCWWCKHEWEVSSESSSTCEACGSIYSFGVDLKKVANKVNSDELSQLLENALNRKNYDAKEMDDTRRG